MMDVKVSKDKHVSRWVDWESLIVMLDEIESKIVQNDEEGNW